jgi:hypothetical protein
MRVKLQVFTEDSNNLGRYYRFAVIDLEKTSPYPANFVCLLPSAIDNRATKSQTRFSKLFGNNSVEQAELLLVKALRSETERGVRTEIERRLAQINPEKYLQQRCIACGTLFRPQKRAKLKHCLCGDCFTKKFAHQTG